MNLYEHTIVARQDTSPAQVKQLTEKYSKIVEKNEGEIVQTEDWGLLNLAYVIKKNKKGIYMHFKIKGPGKIIDENKDKYECFIANDNSVGQIVLSGKIEELDKIMVDLKASNIKNIKLPVSAPFHCKLMNNATLVMKEEIAKLNFNEPKNILISNVTGKEISDSNELKELLVKQIESSVRWRESVLLMIEKGVTEFIEIGPGKVLSGLIKRIDKNVKVSAINSEEDIKLININE